MKRTVLLVLVVVACGLRWMIERPIIVANILGVAAGGLFAFELVRYHLQARRLRREWTAPTPETDYVECKARRKLGGLGVDTVCQLRDGHEGPHEGYLNPISWAREQQ